MCKIFGIDLGTTNSIIGYGDEYLSELIPSAISLNNKTVVPNSSIEEDTVKSYKVNMGLGTESKLSINASTVVLKSLKEIVKEEKGWDVVKVAISVPAYFSSEQRTAVTQAATNAGLEVVHIVNEPTAAAYTGVQDSSQYTVVYDLGGGTFDCTLMYPNSNGVFSVLGTDGKIIGGDNLDLNIVNHILDKTKLPMYKRTKSRMSKASVLANEIKIKFQEMYKKGIKDYTHEIAIEDLNNENVTVSVSMAEYKQITEKTFRDTLLITNSLLQTHMPKGYKAKVLFVGGSTNCPYLREYVLKSLKLEETACTQDYSRDFIVAEGIAKLAKDIEDNGGLISNLQDVTKQLGIELDDGTIGVVINENTRIPCTRSYIFNNKRRADNIEIKLYQGSKVLAKDNDYQGSIKYKYSRVMEENEGEIEVKITVNVNGVIELKVEDLVSFSEPKVLILDRS